MFHSRSMTCCPTTMSTEAANEEMESQYTALRPERTTTLTFLGKDRDASVILHVHPHERLPEVDDLKREMSEQLVRVGGRQQVCGVGDRVGSRRLGREQDDLVEIGVDDRRSESTELGQQLDERLLHQAVEEAMDSRVEHAGRARADPAPEIVDENVGDGVVAPQTSLVEIPRLDHRLEDGEGLGRQDGVSESERVVGASLGVLVQVVRRRVKRKRPRTTSLQFVDERRLEQGIDGEVLDGDAERDVGVAT